MIIYFITEEPFLDYFTEKISHALGNALPAVLYDFLCQLLFSFFSPVILALPFRFFDLLNLVRGVCDTDSILNIL